MLSKAKETQLNAQLKGAGGYSRSFRWLFPMSDRKGFVGGWQAILIKATHLKAALAFDSVPTTSLQKKGKASKKSAMEERHNFKLPWFRTMYHYVQRNFHIVCGDDDDSGGDPGHHVLHMCRKR